MSDLHDPADAAEAASTALTRRDLLAGAVGTLGGAMLAGLPVALGAQQTDAPTRPVVPADATRTPKTAPSATVTAPPPKWDVVTVSVPSATSIGTVCVFAAVISTTPNPSFRSTGFA